MPLPNLVNVIANSMVNALFDKTDWEEWRYCYFSGREFREQYLERFSDRETKKDFERRKDLTPIPSYARLEINRVKNALSNRFPDINRRGGSRLWQEAKEGTGRGVDRRGSSINSFTSKMVLPDLLVMGKVGVLVDAPRVTGDSAADVPTDFRPYLSYYPIEHIEKAVPAPAESPSDWTAVLLKDVNQEFDIEQCEATDVTTFKYYYLDPDRNNLVTVVRVDEHGENIGAPIETNLNKIPFVVYDILESLIKDVCSYQIAHLNLISADTSYALDSNYTFMVRQRGNSMPAHLIGEDDEVSAGVKKGLWYEKGVEAPAFIAPPTGPPKFSLEQRKAFEDEVHRLVTGTLANLAEDGTIEAGLAFIGQCLEDGEARVWDHWTAFESNSPEGRDVPQILYPDDWSLKTDEQRLDEAGKYIDIMNKLPGRVGKKEAAKTAYEKLFRGKVSPETLDKIKAEVDAAPYTTSDADIVIRAKKEGIFCVETAALALGADEDEAEKAKQDQVDRAAAVAVAQADAAQGINQNNPDASADGNSAAIARGDDGATNFNQGPGTRGEQEGSTENE